MAQKWRCNDPSLNGLPAPVKNRFFYGMLLTDEMLRKDQHYFDGKRWLLNRLALGKGVLTGLDFVDLKEDCDQKTPTLKRWHVYLSPGVAVDGYGREIVAPEGKKTPSGDPAPLQVPICSIDKEGNEVLPQDGVGFLAQLCGVTPAQVEQSKWTFPDPILLELQIAYTPMPTDPASVKAGHCANECEPSSLREQFRVRVTMIAADPRRDRSTAIDQEAHRKDSDGSPQAAGRLLSPNETRFDTQRSKRLAQGMVRHLVGARASKTG